MRKMRKKGTIEKKTRCCEIGGRRMGFFRFKEGIHIYR